MLLCNQLQQHKLRIIYHLQYYKSWNNNSTKVGITFHIFLLTLQPNMRDEEKIHLINFKVIQFLMMVTFKVFQYYLTD